jgi:hypothetical protein
MSTVKASKLRYVLRGIGPGLPDCEFPILLSGLAEWVPQVGVPADLCLTCRHSAQVSEY